MAHVKVMSGNDICVVVNDDFMSCYPHSNCMTFISLHCMSSVSLVSQLASYSRDKDKMIAFDGGYYKLHPLLLLSSFVEHT